MNDKYSKFLTNKLLTELFQKYNCVNKISKHLNIPNKTLLIYFNKFNIKYKKLNRQIYNLDLFENYSEESFYLAGFIAADGCVYKNRLDLFLSQKDINFLEKISHFFGKNIKILQYNRNIKSSCVNGVYKVCGIQVTNNKIISDLKQFNITPKKSLTYEFPQNIKSHPYINHFIRGYIDGDGSWSACKGSQVIKCSMLGTKDCLENIRDIININCNSKDYGCFYKLGNVYYLEYGGAIICSKIRKFLYKDSTLYLDRKRNIPYSVITKSDEEISMNDCILPKISKEELINDLKNYNTQTMIAKKHNCSKGLITYLKKKYNII